MPCIPDQEATTVVQKLVDEMFCRFSPPEQLHSDQGAQFESKLMKEICKTLHIKNIIPEPHPITRSAMDWLNGLTGRY